MNAKQVSSTHRNKLRHLTIFRNWNTQRKTVNQQGQTVFSTKKWPRTQMRDHFEIGGVFQPTVKGELDKEDREVCGLQEMESHVARKAA